MSAWPKKKEVQGKQVEFYKIKNRKLSRIFYKIAFSMENGGGGSAPSTPSDSDQMAVFRNLEKTGDLDTIRDVFFDNMIMVGVGNVLEKEEEILEENITIDFELLSAALEVYLSGFLDGSAGKAH